VILLKPAVIISLNSHWYFFLYYIWLKILNMKAIGWILIAVGIVMILIKGFSVPVEKKVIDIGPIQVNKTENKWIGWPTYAGGIIAIVGAVLVVGARKR